MTRFPERLLACLLSAALLLTAALILPQAATAKTVAIIFDTSGSMHNRYRLPSFGMRLLAASIDGRAGFDRLLVMTHDEYSRALGLAIPDFASSTGGRSFPLSQLTERLPASTIKEFEITSGQMHQALIEQLVTEFTYDENVGTPYGPVEVMLNRLAADAGQGEEIVLVIVSDGEYYDPEFFSNGRQVPRMREAFRSVRETLQALSATLSVSYLFIDALGGSALRDTVRDQGVRDTLLEEFNGDASIGAKYVSNPDQLWDALKDIVAEVAGTDRDQQARYIEYSGNTIRIEAPLSISHIVIVSSGPANGTVPALQSTSFPVAPSDRRRLSTRMTGTDSALGNRPPRAGVVEHLWFQNAVPPGEHTLSFDASVDEDVFLLFETRAISDLRVLDESGTEIAPRPDGTIELFRDGTYTFASRILDDPAALTPVDFDVLPPGLSMQLTLTGAPGPEVTTMDLDHALDEGRYTWRTTEAGTYVAFSRASAGILSPKSAPLQIEVLDTSARLTISDIRPVDLCTDCGAGEISAPANASGGLRVAEFDIGVEATLGGELDLAGTVLPPGIVLRDEAGTAIDLNDPIDFGGSGTRRFSLWREGAVGLEDIMQGLHDVEIRAAPVGRWTGQTVSADAVVKLAPPGMGLALVDVSQPVNPGRIEDGLRVPGGDLLRGEMSAQFAMTDLLAAPDPEEVDTLVSVVANGGLAWLVRYDLRIPDPAQVGFHAVEIAPETRYWCLCWLWGANLFRGTDFRDVTVSYRFPASGVALQQASASVPVAMPIGTTQGSLSCLLNILYLWLAWMMLRGTWALIWTHRFPTGSMIEIADGNNPLRYKRLDKGNSVWWKAWLAAFIGNPDEVRVVEGLRIRATANGGVVDISRHVPNWRLERIDATFAELKENQPRKTEHRLIWGDRLQSTANPALSIRFKKKGGD